MKNRLTNYNFWISMFSAVLLILQALKIEFDVAYVNEIFTAVLGLLVVVGIVIDPTKTGTKTTQQREDKEPINGQKEEVKLPIIQEDETNNIDNENDFQTVLNKIVHDIEAKLNEFSVENKTFVDGEVQGGEEKEIETIKSPQQVEENARVEEKVDSNPAVAEMDNPYFI
ncbi:MAG: hypothetical protein IKY10_02030 [Clostridia bacterium]|nr:hypothetical protein [Clostridia bacterium]